MNITLPLDQMTTEEKLQAMEALWMDLTSNESEFKSPAWHASVLQERELRTRAGLESFIEWEKAKENLRRDLNEDSNSSVRQR